MSPKRITFVTGQLAEPALQHLLAGYSFEFQYEVVALPAQVAALMTTGYIAKRLPKSVTGTVMIPGGCGGDLSVLRAVVDGPVVRGPVDLHDVPRHFGQRPKPVAYGPARLSIIAEIVDAPALSLPRIVRRARRYRRDGADWIDIGCTPGAAFGHLGEAVRELVGLGFNVSVDTFDPDELITASRAGARLFLSVNSSNLGVAGKLDGRVVVIPDFGKGLRSLYRNAEALAKRRVSFILDPILDPLCQGAASSVARYVQVRHRFPEASLLMGVGNLVELTAADNVGLNAMLAGFCAELGVDYALTTEVVGWNRGAVRQLAVARQIMEHAAAQRILPRQFDNRLLVARDAERSQYTAAQLAAMSRKIKDRNFRIFTVDGRIHLFNKDVYIKAKTADEAFATLDVNSAPHAFYLGRELQKAETAITLGKTYVQEQPLDWGYITKKKPGGGRRK